jgi:hypothetical protein
MLIAWQTSKLQEITYLSELCKQLHKLSFLHVVVVKVVHNRCDQSKVEQLQR